LLFVELIDELYSGVPSVGAADIQSDFLAPYALTASALLLLPGAVGLVVEPYLFVLADRYPRKWFVCGGLFAMAAAAFAAAAAPNIYVLAVAVTVAFVGSGAGVALSQATLVDARPHQRERVLTQWTLLGEIGDLLSPLLMAALAATSLGWRVGYCVVGGMVLCWAVLLVRQPFPDDRVGTENGEVDPASVDAEDDDAEPGVLAALAEALRNRRLLFWLGATALCDLLDEIVIVFAALHLRDALDAGPIARSIVIGAGIGGAIAGVLVLDRLLTRWTALRLLLVSSVACAAVYAAWVAAPTLWLSAPLFFLVGATAAPMYPLASAQAYRAMPGRSGTVNAAGHVFSPITVAVPLGLGALADVTSPQVALALLLVQPVGLAIVAAYALRWERSERK
jgi:MFS family permease